MLLRELKRAFTWLAFAATLVVACVLSPRAAYAAILPACENQPFTRMPVEWIAATALPADMGLDDVGDKSACEERREARHDEPSDAGDPRVAAMCDDRGASVVAPPRVMPIVDARIEAASSCGSQVSGPSCAPAPNDSPLASPTFAILDPALLGGGLSIPAATGELIAFPVAHGAPLRGVTRDIDHPPR